MQAGKMILAAVVAAGVMAAAGPAIASVVANPTSDFSITNGNPNGQWSYGWMPTDFSEFNLYAHSGTVPDGSPYWDTAGVTAPIIWVNLGLDVQYGVPKGWLSLEPIVSKRSVLRWTAPSDGSVEVTGEFLAGEYVYGGQTVAVRMNNSPWWSPAFDYGSFDLQTTVAAGDTIDFVASGSDYYGNVPLAAVITYLPEPGSAVLLIAGALALIRRRAAKQM